MNIVQRAYDMLKKLHGDIGDYIFVGMEVDPYYHDDEWHEEDEDYIEFYFHNKNWDVDLNCIIVPCTKGYAARISYLTDSPCKETTWLSFGICDDEYSKVNFDYWLQMGALEGYSEGE